MFGNGAMAPDGCDKMRSATLECTELEDTIPMATAEAARDQFGELLERHRAIVFKVAGSYVRSPEDRADLAQEIAVQLWRAWPSYDPARSFTTWMYRIALNVAIGFARGDGLRRRHAVPLDEELHDLADNGPDHETGQQLRLLQTFIARQVPLDRALLLLYLDERPQREIAEILGISETNVSTKIGRLKQRIRDEL
jgi:RNA polymerase sigma-70 factor (ECF subfamily)